MGAGGFLQSISWRCWPCSPPTPKGTSMPGGYWLPPRPNENAWDTSASLLTGPMSRSRWQGPGSARAYGLGGRLVRGGGPLGRRGREVRTAGPRRARPPQHRVGEPHPDGAPCGRARWRRPEQCRDRASPVRVRGDREEPPKPHLPKARGNRPASTPPPRPGQRLISLASRTTTLAERLHLPRRPKASRSRYQICSSGQGRFRGLDHPEPLLSILPDGYRRRHPWLSIILERRIGTHITRAKESSCCAHVSRSAVPVEVP